MLNKMREQTTLFDNELKYRFDGPVYSPEKDNARLTGQIERIFSLMKDARWRTLEEISKATNDPPASISAQLRHLRKMRFGRHAVDKRPRGERSQGLWEYRLIINNAYAWED